MKGFLRLLCLILALNAFVSAEGESARLFDPSLIEHPVLVAGDVHSVSAFPETDPHLGPLHQAFLVHQVASGHGHNASQFSGPSRPLPHVQCNACMPGGSLWLNRSVVPTSIGMKLLFPEHYFW